MNRRPSEPALLTAGVRAILVAASVLVLGVGLPLYFLPHLTHLAFAWTIASPLMAGSLGAAYLAAGLFEALAARARLWAEARIAVPAVLIFTLLTLGVTLVHLDRFHLDAPAASARFVAWVWLAVYIVVPILMAVLWLLQIRAPGSEPPRLAPLSAPLRLVWIACAAALLALGAFMLILPLDGEKLWPWALTPLTARAVGAWLAGLGVLALHAGIEGDLIRLHAIFPAMTVFAVLEGSVLLRFGGELDWTGPGAWTYALVLAAWFAIGTYNWARGAASRDRRVEPIQR